MKKLKKRKMREREYYEKEQLYYIYPPKYPLNYEELTDLFPSLLGNISIECEIGWLNLIFELCMQIAKIIGENDLNIHATQIKEKWGTLHFYMSEITDEIEALIECAEKLSVTTCELCGSNKGDLFKYGWFMVRCPECKAKEIKNTEK